MKLCVITTLMLTMLKCFLPFFSNTLRGARILTTPLNSACQNLYKTTEISSEAEQIKICCAVKQLKIFL